MRHGTGGWWARTVALATGLAVVPSGVAAAPVDPSIVVDGPGIGPALASVVLVGLVGAAVLGRDGAFLDRAVDDTMDRPAVAVVYGLLAYVLVLFAGFYANDLLMRVGVAGTPLGTVVLVVLGGGVLLLSSLGYLVVGTLLTDLHGGRRPRHGLVLGALLSGVGWLLLPVPFAVATWVLVAAVGVGGPTRTWVHSERAVHPDA